MRNFSIKWKFSLSFIALSIAIVSIFVYMAKQTFESDKISYVFDSEQVQLQNLSKQVQQRIERVLFDSRSVLAGYNFEEKKLNSLGQSLFADQKEILAIELWDKALSQELLKIEKKNDLIPQRSKSLEAGSQIEIQPLGQDRFLLMSQFKNNNVNNLELRIVAEIKDLLPATSSGCLIFSKEEALLKIIGTKVDDSLIREVLADLNQDRSEKTMLREFTNKRYLISSAHIPFGNLRLTSFISEEKALSALNVLFNKSILFVIFSIFATILISLMLSSSLTYRLQLLTGTAEKIGRGDFSQNTIIKSKDEVGVLSQAFAKMGIEIERLLIETKDKIRMESELKTARVVQESLFPEEPHCKIKDFEISGLHVNYTECGGDWWYYFKRGESLFVVIADATGHGTSAALITSAARALFSHLENSDLNLVEMAKQWNTAIGACSRQKVLMTAFMMQIDLSTGKIACLNASHEPPLVLRQDGTLEPVLTPLNPRLGTLKKDIEWKQHEFQLNADEKILLYTDGLVSIENPEGKVLGEKRLIRALDKRSSRNMKSAKMVEEIYSIFEEHRQDKPLSDDVTLVVVGRVA